MNFQAFHDKFPKIAEEESKTIILSENNPYNLPSGAYLFVEMFCNDRKCDCRRVFFMVFSSNNDPLAVICWGWETRDFYKKWLGSYDKEMINDMIGPILNDTSYQSKYAPKILEMYKQLLLNDKDYCESVKQHYKIFKRGNPLFGTISSFRRF